MPARVGRYMLFKSILYVDDDPDIRSIVRAALCRIPGLQVSTVDSGEKAVDLAHEVRPDLVLMDVMMPGLDGPSALKRIQASVLLADTPVIFMTAKVLPAEINQFLQMGAIGVIVKPFDPLTLYDDLCGLWKRQYKTVRHSTEFSRVSAVQGEIDLLTASFLRRARADVTNLSALIWLAKDGDRSMFLEIERIAHSIHGAAAMFGFSDVSATGEQIARAAGGMKHGDHVNRSTCDPAERMQLLAFCRQLDLNVEAAWLTPPQCAMFQRTARDK
jgi:two-component system, OmpR family, response regulator